LPAKGFHFARTTGDPIGRAKLRILPDDRLRPNDKNRGAARSTARNIRGISVD
jgi:hypothetical protein